MHLIGAPVHNLCIKNVQRGPGAACHRSSIVIPLISNRLTSCHLNGYLRIRALYHCCINRLLHNRHRLDYRNLNNGASRTANRIDHLNLIEAAILTRYINNAQFRIGAGRI